MHLCKKSDFWVTFGKLGKLQYDKFNVKTNLRKNMTGFTKDEEILAAFGDAAFLHVWTWPNLFRNKGKTSDSSDGKEICDLTVIFGNTVILFSDKRIEFNLDKPLEVSWKRWARKAIYDSMKQLIGAEKWIKTNPNQIFIDKKCTKRIPMSLPPSNEIKFIRIVVAHGIENIAQVKANDGSLSFTNELKGEDNWQGPNAIPFTLGLISETEFVHVFTDDSIKYVLSEFDTVEDFISYLMEREKLFLLNKKINISKESDIIHLYYENYSEEQQIHGILSASDLLGDTVSIEKEPIKSLYLNPQYLAKKKADKVSYFWDYLINASAVRSLKSSTEYGNWNHISEMEPALRVMANINRFHRRMLSEGFMDFYDRVIPGRRCTRLIWDMSDTSIGYFFLLLPYIENSMTLDIYKNQRKNMLQDYAQIYGGMYPNLSSFICIAAKTRTSDAPLHDDLFDEAQCYVYQDYKNWDEDMKRQSENLRIEYEKRGDLKKRIAYEHVGWEFPLVDPTTQ